MSVEDIAMTFSASSPLQAMPLDATRNSNRNMIFEAAWEISERITHFRVHLRGHDTLYQTELSSWRRAKQRARRTRRVNSAWAFNFVSSHLAPHLVIVSHRAWTVSKRSPVILRSELSANGAPHPYARRLWFLLVSQAKHQA
jgi:hypothetical protein